jgi:chromosomal replication initiation ATPase DnaA
MLGSPRADLVPRSLRVPCGAACIRTDRHLRHIIEHAVAPSFAVAYAALWMPTRGSPAEAFARQVAMYLAHIGLGLSFTTVARLFGRDRRTVAHACAVVEDRRDARALDRALDLLEGALRLLARREA